MTHGHISGAIRIVSLRLIIYLYQRHSLKGLGRQHRMMGRKNRILNAKGLSYKTGKAGNILPATMIHFEEDPVTSKSAGSTAPEKSKVQFDHKRFKEIGGGVEEKYLGPCPVKVWF